MSAGAKILGHSIHPMLVVFPLGLLSTGAIFDVVFLITGDIAFSLIAFWMIASGLIGGTVAALFGWIDWAAIPSGTRAKFIGLAHGLVNSAVMLVFLVSLTLRLASPTGTGYTAILLAWVGVLLAVVGGWLGGELVQRLGISVHPGANPDAPSSLSKERTDVEGIPVAQNRMG